MQFWRWVKDRENRLGENMQLKEVSANPSGSPWAQSRLAKESLVSLEWVCFSISETGGHWQQDAYRRRALSTDAVMMFVSPHWPPRAQQSKLPCLSLPPSQSRGERTTLHLSGARPEQRKETKFGRQEAAETHVCPPGALGTAIWPVLRAMDARLSQASPGWRRNTVCWVYSTLFLPKGLALFIIKT